MDDVWDRHPELDPDDHDCEAHEDCPLHSPKLADAEEKDG